MVSGPQDAKYYLLADGVSSGTIIRVINPDNNKTIYAKVLGEIRLTQTTNLVDSLIPKLNITYNLAI